MKHLLVLSVIVGAPFLARSTFAQVPADKPATNITLRVGSVIYSNVVFVSRTPASVTFRHQAGIATVDISQLSPDLQASFQYDPAKAVAYNEEQRKQQALYKEQQAVAGRVLIRAGWDQAIAKGQEPPFRVWRGTVVDFREMFEWEQEMRRSEKSQPAEVRGGEPGRDIWEQNFKRWREEHRRIVERWQQWERKFKSWGSVTQVTADGLLIAKSGSDEPVLLRNYPFQVVDGSSISFLAISDGTYEYITVLGGNKTIRAYDFGTAPPADRQLPVVPLSQFIKGMQRSE